MGEIGEPVPAPRESAAIAEPPIRGHQGRPLNRQAMEPQPVRELADAEREPGRFAEIVRAVVEH